MLLRAGPLNALYARYLYPTGAPRPDFSKPAGAAALVPAGSVSWQIFANPVTLFVGGVLAVILELALPPVRHGVWDHSNFRTEPRLRLQRTGLAAMVTIYGPADTARRMIEGVNAAHARIRGTTAAGQPYAATDEPLLTWVQATAAFGFAEAYSHLATPLDDERWDAVFAEGAPVARLYGAVTAPADLAGWKRLLATTAPDLEGSEALETFLCIMTTEPILPPGNRAMQPALVRIAAGLVPETAGLPLSDWRPRRADRALARLAAASAERIRLPASPPVLACRRLGLDPADALSGALPSPDANRDALFSR